MKLLIPFLLGAVVLGLVTDRLDGRVWSAIIGTAIAVTALYYLVARLMQ